MSNSKVKIITSNIGFQKAVDIRLEGVSNIESVEITPLEDVSIKINNKNVFNEEKVDYISNIKDNCVYEFIEDIEILEKGGGIVKYVKKIYKDGDWEYVEYEEKDKNEYKKDKDGNVILYYRVIYERLGEINNIYVYDTEERYEKNDDGIIIFYYKLKKNGKFKQALGSTNIDEYENENGQAVTYVKIIKDWNYEKFNENNKNMYDGSDTSDITSIGHVIINKLKLEGDPTIFYRLVKFTRETNSNSIYETNEKGEKIEFAYNKYKYAYQVYEKSNDELYKKDEDKNVVKYYKEVKKENTHVIGSNFTSSEGWVLESDENGLLIKYAKNVKNNKYEIYNSKNKENYFKSDGEKIGVPFILSFSYKNDDNIIEKKHAYFSINIPYKTMGSNLVLPLFYRPFYFNSVLLLTPQNLTPKYDYDIRTLHKSKRDNSKEIHPEKCYGRLFYSIANGCSIREDLGDSNIYKLNDVTLSYINGSEAGSMIIDKPFRCFSEMDSSTNGKVNSIKGNDKKTREMMYGITEPFAYENLTDVKTVKEKRYATKAIGGDATNKSLKINYAFGAAFDEGSGGKTVETEWKHEYIPGSNKTAEEVSYKLTWTTYYAFTKGNEKWKQTRYRNIINIYKKGSKDKDYILMFTHDNPYRRSNFSYNENDKDGIRWYIDYTLYSVSTGESSISVSGVYESSYEIDGNIRRCGVPCVKNKYKMEKYRLNEDILDNGIVEEGIEDIYSEIYKDGSTLKNKNGDIIPVYKITDSDSPIEIDTSKWLDVSFNVTEGHPEDDDDADTTFVGLNDVKFYDDIYWGKEKDEDGNEYEGVHVGGYSSSNIRYFALASANNTGDNTDSGYNGENEILTFLKSLYGIGVTEDKFWGNTYVKYNGVNINDYIPLENVSFPSTRNSGWKSMHTYLKNTSGNDVWLSGKGLNNGVENKTHMCIDVTDVLESLRKNPYQKINHLWRCAGGRWRYWVIGICDNYTCLDSSSYEEENKHMYSIIKQHTSRFAIIRLYKCISE